MPLFLKSEHERPVTVLIGSSPTILGVVNFQGVRNARLGLNDPFIPWLTNFDTPIPYANTTFLAPTGILGNGGVWAFPQHTASANNGVPNLTPFLYVKKPRYPRGI